MYSVEDLLSPVPGDNPCGSDPTGDLLFLEIDSLVSAGERETEKQDWISLQNKCVELLRRSKHLQIAVALALASLQTQGLAGFHQGLQVIKGLLAQYWDELHPKLDAELDNDPGERIGTLAALYTRVGTERDRWKFQERLRKAPLFRSRKAAFTAKDIERAEKGAPDAVSLAEIQAALMVMDSGEIDSCNNVLSSSIEVVREIESCLRLKAGKAAESWRALTETLQELQYRLTTLAAAVGKTGTPTSADRPVDHSSEALTSMPNETALQSAVPVTVSVGSTTILSRQDVIRVLSLVCDYYKDAEPSSPIPLLLRRAQRLVNKDFTQIVEDLTPEAIDNVRKLAGIKDGE